MSKPSPRQPRQVVPLTADNVEFISRGPDLPLPQAAILALLAIVEKYPHPGEGLDTSTAGQDNVPVA